MPIALFLIPLFIFFIVFCIFALSGFYHIIRFELINGITIGVTAIFVIGSIAIVILFGSYLIGIDWNTTLTIPTLSSGEPNTNTPESILSF